MPEAVMISTEALVLLTQAAEEIIARWPEPCQTKLADAITAARGAPDEAGVELD